MHKEAGIEMEMFRRNGANVPAYLAMTGLFHPIRYPSTYGMEEREQMAVNSSNPRELQYIAFDLLLEGKTEKARKYLERARDMHLIERTIKGKTAERGPIIGLQGVLENLEDIQQLIIGCRDEILRERAKRFIRA